MSGGLFDCGPRSPAASWGLLVLRATVGGMMAIGHGWPKLMAFAQLKDEWYRPWFLGFLSRPASLGLTITAELVASSLLVAGLMTRPAAFLLAVGMGVAAFGVHGASPWFLGPEVTSAKEPALLYLAPAIALLVSGAGGYSLDAMISNRRR